MKYKVYFSPNTTGTGTSTINLEVLGHYNFSEEWILIIPESEISLKKFNCKVIEIPKNNFKFLHIIIAYIYIKLLSLLGKVSHITVLANYFPFAPRNVHVSVILRHPYLVKYDTNEVLSKRRRYIEFFRFFAFRLTLINKPTVFVQSASMRTLFFKTYPFYPKHMVDVLPNPICEEIIRINNAVSLNNYEFNHYVYPSTYYEHKNFEFIFKYIESYCEVLKKINFKIHLFIEELDVVKICSEFKIDSTVINKFIIMNGKVSHYNVLQVIKKCRLVLFPSKRETFGNGIYESLALQKRVIINCSNYSNNFINNDNVDILDMNDFSNLSNLHEFVISEKSFNKKHQINNISVSDWMSKLIFHEKH